MEEIKSILEFNKYIVNNISFNYNYDYNKQDSIELDFDLDHECLIENDRMNIRLFLTVFPEPVKNNYPFTIKVGVDGYFRVKGEMNDRLQANAIAILYPYVRAIVSNYTAQANVLPLFLPPINTMKYLESKNSNIQNM